MLYEFHQNENSKKPNSVNATYVITGVQQLPEPPATNGNANDFDGDGDDVMQSSPYISSSMPNQDEVIDSIHTTSIILVREEDLEGMEKPVHSSMWSSLLTTGCRCEVVFSVHCVDSLIQSTAGVFAGS